MEDAQVKMVLFAEFAQAPSPIEAPHPVDENLNLDSAVLGLTQGMEDPQADRIHVENIALQNDFIFGFFNFGDDITKVIIARKIELNRIPVGLYHDCVPDVKLA